MTKQEAKQKAEQGFRVRNKKWSPEGWIKIDKPNFIDEKGEFFAFSDYFDKVELPNGWEVVEEPQITIKEKLNINTMTNHQ